ncbi:MAG: Lrp/AsnC family transcriptional regulator [Acidobacteriota bacterium]|nr:Lrp/AsnC family transcriptional regulator [Acidobacteriota bacterium]
MADFDSIDARILDALQRNGRIAQVEIAREVGLAPSAVLERMRKLEARGVIRGYAAILDPKAAGLALLAFIAVRTTEAPEEEDTVAASLGKVPEVLEVHHVAGDDCFLVKVRARDAEHLGELLKGRIGRIKGVRSTRTTIVLGTLKETQQLPLPDKTEELAG